MIGMQHSLDIHGIHLRAARGASAATTFRMLGVLTLGLGLTACEPPAQNTPAPVFGGQGAALDEQAQALPAGVDDSVLSGPCAPAAPVGQGTLIDDFEDGDIRPFRQFQREGWWFAASDSTPGEMSPAKNEFKADALPQAESTPQNRLAAHLSAKGFSDWGVVWGTTLRWVDNGVRCPFNATGFSGIRFKAKGQGRVRVALGIPETVPPDDEGKCTQRCYDTHSRVVNLSDQWETYDIPWAQLQQWGWGTEAKFDPAHLLSLQFAVDKKDLPADFWLDDIEFTQAGTPAVAAPAVAPQGAVSGPTAAAPSAVSPAASPVNAAPPVNAASPAQLAPRPASSAQPVK